MGIYKDYCDLVKLYEKYKYKYPYWRAIKVSIFIIKRKAHFWLNWKIRRVRAFKYKFEDCKRKLRTQKLLFQYWKKDTRIFKGVYCGEFSPSMLDLVTGKAYFKYTWRKLWTLKF